MYKRQSFYCRNTRLKKSLRRPTRVIVYCQKNFVSNPGKRQSSYPWFNRALLAEEIAMPPRHPAHINPLKAFSKPLWGYLTNLRQHGFTLATKNKTVTNSHGKLAFEI